MKVTLLSSYGAHAQIAEFDSPNAPTPGDHFNVKKRLGRGFAKTTFRVVSRLFDVVIEQKPGGPESVPPCKLEGVTCMVAPAGQREETTA